MLGEIVEADGRTYEVIFDGERWLDGRTGLVHGWGFRHSSLREMSGDRTPSDRAQQHRSMRRTQDRFEAMFK